MPSSQLQTLLIARLEADTSAEDPLRPLVLAAFEGPKALANLLNEEAAAKPHTPERTDRPSPTPNPTPGTYFSSVTVATDDQAETGAGLQLEGGVAKLYDVLHTRSTNASPFPPGHS